MLLSCPLFQTVWKLSVPFHPGGVLCCLDSIQEMWAAGGVQVLASWHAGQDQCKHWPAAEAQVCRRRSSGGERKREPVVPPERLAPPYPQHESAELCHLGVSFACEWNGLCQFTSCVCRKTRADCALAVASKETFHSGAD